MVFTRKKAGAGVNPDSPTRTQPETSLRTGKELIIHSTSSSIISGREGL